MKPTRPTRREEEINAKVTNKATELALRRAEEDYNLGNEVRQCWSLKAQDAGMELREYIHKALAFYDEYKLSLIHISEPTRPY